MNVDPMLEMELLEGIQAQFHSGAYTTEDLREWVQVVDRIRGKLFIDSVKLNLATQLRKDLYRAVVARQ